jgi:dUTP pyrophosphatase
MDDLIMKVAYGDKQLSRKVKIPREGDVGLDLYAAEDIFVDLKSAALINLGVSIELPKGYWLELRDRSSVSKYLHVLAGIIDNSYRGVIKARMYCHKARDSEERDVLIDPNADLPTGHQLIGPGSKPYPGKSSFAGFKVSKGDKLVQGIIRKLIVPTSIVETDILSDTDRGSGGFGSTGS